jgi:hypothetical protein
MPRPSGKQASTQAAPARILWLSSASRLQTTPCPLKDPRGDAGHSHGCDAAIAKRPCPRSSDSLTLPLSTRVESETARLHHTARRRAGGVTTGDTSARCGSARDRLLNPASSEGMGDRLRGFHRGLKESGYVEGETSRLNIVGPTINLTAYPR